MKRAVVIVSLLVSTLISTGCMSREEHARAEADHRAQYMLNQAKNIVLGIQYIKDPRTNLCFAYYWGGLSDGGPALATVPCETASNYVTTPPVGKDE